MGQTEILELLEKYPNKWFTYKQIAIRLDQQTQATMDNLKRLRRHSCVESRLYKGYKEMPVILYKYKKPDKIKK